MSKRTTFDEDMSYGKELEAEKRARSYTLSQIKKKEDLKLAKSENAMKLFKEYLKYYNENYPKSKFEICWDFDDEDIELIGDDFEDLLDSFTDVQLYKIHYIGLYSFIEINLRSVKSRDSNSLAINMIKRRLSEKSDRVQLNELEEQKHGEWEAYKLKSELKASGNQKDIKTIKQKEIDNQIKKLAEENKFYCPVCNGILEIPDKKFKSINNIRFRCSNTNCDAYNKELTFRRVEMWSKQVRHFNGVNDGSIKSYNCPNCKQTLRLNEYLYVSDILVSINPIKIPGRTEDNISIIFESSRLKNRSYPKDDELYCESCGSTFKKATFELQDEINRLKAIQEVATIEKEPEIPEFPEIPIESEKKTELNMRVTRLQ